MRSSTRARARTPSGAGAYSYVADAVGLASTPLLKTPPAITATLRSMQSGSTTSSPERSSRVSRFARSTQSISHSRTKRAAVSVLFVPTPIVVTTPSSRSRTSSGRASSMACSRWSSGSWRKTTSTRSRPSRSRLSSSDWHTPRALKSKTGPTPSVSAKSDGSPAASGRSSRPTFVETTNASRGLVCSTRPTNRSVRPCPYKGATSNRRSPCSHARSITASASSELTGENSAPSGTPPTPSFVYTAGITVLPRLDEIRRPGTRCEDHTAVALLDDNVAVIGSHGDIAAHEARATMCRANRRLLQATSPPRQGNLEAAPRAKAAYRAFRPRVGQRRQQLESVVRLQEHLADGRSAAQVPVDLKDRQRVRPLRRVRVEQVLDRAQAKEREQMLVRQ